MPTAITGVFPCYENQFAIGDAGGQSAPTTNIADCTTFSVAFNNGVEEWTAFGSEGWLSRMQTAKNIVNTISSKRNIGDAGNDMVAGVSFKNGRQVEKDFAWNLPDGTTAWFKNAIINVTSNSGGDATNVAPLEFQVMSNGKPVVTPAA